MPSQMLASSKKMGNNQLQLKSQPRCDSTKYDIPLPWNQQRFDRICDENETNYITACSTGGPFFLCFLLKIDFSDESCTEELSVFDKPASDYAGRNGDFLGWVLGHCLTDIMIWPHGSCWKQNDYVRDCDVQYSNLLHNNENELIILAAMNFSATRHLHRVLLHISCENVYCTFRRCGIWKEHILKWA